MLLVEFPAPIEVFHRMPRHPDWRYEYLDGQVCLTPRGRPLYTALDLGADRAPRSPGDVDVGPMTDADTPAVEALAEDVWSRLDPYASHETAAGAREEVRDELRRALAGRSRFFVARRDGTVVGIAALRTGRWGVRRDETEILLAWLTVHPDHRSTGVAGALLDAAADDARRDGHPRVLSAVSVANRPSLHWHIGQGFTVLPDPFRHLYDDLPRAPRPTPASPG